MKNPIAPIGLAAWLLCAIVSDDARDDESLRSGPRQIAAAAADFPIKALLRIDLNRNDRRKDILTPSWENWLWEDGPSGDKVFGLVSVTFRAAGDGQLAGVWYKGLLDYGATMAADGVASSGRNDEAGIDMIVSGLPPGTHSVVTYHNEVRNDPPTPLDVYVGETKRVKGLAPSARAKSIYDVATAYVELHVEAGEDAVIHFRPSRPSATRHPEGPVAGSPGRVVINGIAIDAVDPRLQAAKPFPADGAEHVADGPELTWTPPTSAIVHHLYFGTDPIAVAAATTDSPEYVGRLIPPSHKLPPLDHMLAYYWRVDEVHGGRAEPVKGDVWRFRTRHPAFPTAEGYGRFARGGRGGRVIAVTNLNDRGPGSLRAAVEAEGPRTVVFHVSGLITLESKLVVANPYVTIAGQTAPAKGICIRKFNFGMSGTHDVIIRYIRVRPGNIAEVTLDGMGMRGTDHSIIDHCSISWSHDEAFSSRAAGNITLQRTLISEALNAAGHKNYPPGTQHGYAASIGGQIGSFHHNLLAHCAGRNWSLAGGLNQSARHTGWLDIRNNVVYNWKHRTTDGGAAKVQFVNNYYKPGPASEHFWLLTPERNNIAGFGPQDYHIAGNVMEGHLQQTADEPLAGVRSREPLESFVVDEPFFESYVQTQSAAEAYKNVLADVGCNRPMLDEHDRRVIEEVREGTFHYRGSNTNLPGLPDSQEDVGGWEGYPVEHRPANWDTDQDGMPNDWEMERGLNPQDTADGNADRDGDGYTNLEEYLGWIVGEFS